QALRGQAIASAEVQTIARKPQDEAELPLAQTPSTPCDRVERGLDVGRRAGDDPENLARGRLLPLGLGQRFLETGALGPLLLERLPQGFGLRDQVRVRAQAATTIARSSRDLP